MITERREARDAALRARLVQLADDDRQRILAALTALPALDRLMRAGQRELRHRRGVAQ